MADQRTQLQKKFEPSNRHANFGNILTRLEVRGFRLHATSRVEFRSPVTAFCGPNGTGKTTLLQLAACCYRHGERSFRLHDFFAVGALDPAPFTPAAQLEISTWQGDAKARTITLARRKSRWSDYRKRDERPVAFLGAAQFPPRAEEQAFPFREAAKIVVGSKTPCAADVTAAVARVLGLHYDHIDRAAVSLKARSASILASRRGGLSYSENHMGFGECRVHNLIETLESQPEKSLLLLEEPEISLHQAAQFRLGEYLVSLASRRGHQILLSTHSEHLLRALPQASRILVTRDASGAVHILPGLASSQVASVMTDGHDKALTAVVEDDVAAAILAELLAAADPRLLATTGIVIGGYRDDKGQSIAGGKEAITAALRTMRHSGLRVAAVLDADAKADPAAFVFRLPGTLPPERELFAAAVVRDYWTEIYNLDVPNFESELNGVHHHDWFSRLAARLGRSRDFLVGEACRVYAQAVGAPELVEQLREASSRK